MTTFCHFCHFEAYVLRSGSPGKPRNHHFCQESLLLVYFVDFRAIPAPSGPESVLHQACRLGLYGILAGPLVTSFRRPPSRKAATSLVQGGSTARLDGQGAGRAVWTDARSLVLTGRASVHKPAGSLNPAGLLPPCALRWFPTRETVRDHAHLDTALSGYHACQLWALRARVENVTTLS